ncbi:unnamed protein product [Owenia fusiformis]|uniref:Uncharacterized protein n=1 Tax=Owenia fusiformis TaxID=6347 RepID=A0A8J1XNL9_OWEFU|nr:unnamed protein product [Owenia fusiformis]
MRVLYVSVIFVCALATGCLGQSDCDHCNGQPDGTICEFGCKVISFCMSNIAVTVECPPHEVVDLPSRTCRPPELAAPPCGITINCTGIDGRVPDFATNCTTYHTCINGRYDSTAVCPPGLVFDTIRQLCNWPRSVCVPCGNSNLPSDCDPGTSSSLSAGKAEHHKAALNAVPVNGECECGDEDDDDMNCESLCTCVGEVKVTTFCGDGSVYNKVTKECDEIANVCQPCGTLEC